MKKILFLIMVCMSLNANETVFKSIIKNVSIVDVNKAITDAKKLQNELTKENFKNLVQSWKKVEALYFAGEINEDYIDTPRYIDVYHNLKENLNEQMQRVINSKDEPNIALFKNSFKTINALEYVLFNDENISKREEELARAILSNIIYKLEDIKDVYSEYLKTTKSNEKWENSLLINTMIASTYRLKEWRVGEVGGISSKYKNNPDIKRAEYNISKLSIESIKAILNAHKSIMTKKDFMNFYSKSKEFGVQEQMKNIVDYLNEIDEFIKDYKEEDLANIKKANKLYKKVVNLHNAYYFSLLEQLSITSKIVDADGD